MLNECDLVDSFRYLHPTTVEHFFWLRKMGWTRPNNLGARLDYILVDKRLKVSQAEIMDEIYGSDHCPVMAKIELL